MLHSCRNIMRLDSGRQRCTHFAQMMRVFAIGFLGAAPCRVAQQVETYRARQIAPLRPCLGAHHLSDALFQVRIKRRAARHRTRKAGRITPRHAAWAISEIKWWQAKPLNTAAGTVRPRRPNLVVFHIRFEKACTGHHADFFLQGRFGKHSGDGGVDFHLGHALAWLEFVHLGSPPRHSCQHCPAIQQRSARNGLTAS